MSIQIFVATPLNYYKDWVQCKNPEKYARIFCEAIKKNFNLDLPSDIDEQFFCEDLLASVGWEISEAARSISPLVGRYIGASLHLPGDFDNEEIILPYIIEGDKVNIVSVSNLYRATDKIEPILQKKFPDNFERYKDELDVYRQAIEVSEREKMPIFWSY